MRKSLWLMLAAMVVAVTAPNAHADSLTFTYTFTNEGIFWTTAAIPAVTMPTTVPAADLTATSNTGIVAGCTTSEVVLDNGGFIDTFFTGCGVTSSGIGLFAVTDFSINTPIGNRHTRGFPRPEPSSLALTLLGVKLVLVLRKRRGLRLPQAS